MQKGASPGVGIETPRQPRGTDPLAEAYERYAARLYGYLRAVVRDPQAAEDILQEVFCKLAARGAFFAVAEPERYLFRAAHNEARRWLRNSGREPTDAQDVESLAAPRAEPPDEGEGEAVKRALSQLPPEQAEVVHLKVYEGLTFERIGELLGCSVNTAASRYRYACERLRRILRGLSDER